MPTAQEQEATAPPKVPEIKSIDFTVAGIRYENYGADTVSLKEASELERVYGKTFPDLLADFLRGSVSAIRVIVWGLMTRDNPDLLLDQIDLMINEIDMEVTFVEDEDAGVPTGPGSALDAGPGQSPSDESTTRPSSPTGSTSGPGSGTD